MAVKPRGGIDLLPESGTLEHHHINTHYHVEGGIRVELTRREFILKGGVAATAIGIGILGNARGSYGQGPQDLLAQIRKAGTLKVGMAVDPPFVLRDESGKWYSFNPALVELLGKDMKVRINFVATGWATIVAGLQSGQYDMIGASISATPERRKAINFTIPYGYGGTSWIVRADSPKQLSTLGSLNNPRVTIAFSTNTFQDEITHKLMPLAQYRGLPNASYADLLSELEAGRSDAISIPSYLNAAILSKFSWAKSIPGNLNGVDPTGLAWGVRKSPENQSFLDYLNSFIKKVQGDHTIAHLWKKWITVENSLKG